jgi:hypothetical protein
VRLMKRASPCSVFPNHCTSLIFQLTASLLTSMMICPFRTAPLGLKLRPGSYSIRKLHGRTSLSLSLTKKRPSWKVDRGSIAALTVSHIVAKHLYFRKNGSAVQCYRGCIGQVVLRKEHRCSPVSVTWEAIVGNLCPQTSDITSDLEGL